MQHAGIGPAGHDGAIGWVLRAVLTKFVQQLGIQVELAHFLPGAQHGGAALHGPDVGAGTDGRGPAHGALLVRIFHQAHFVKDAAQITLLIGAQSAIAHARTDRLQPAVHAAFQACMNGKRIPDRAAVFQQLGHLRGHLADREGPAQAQSGGCGIRPQANAVPDFPLQILGLAKQCDFALGRDHQRGMRLGEACEVIKVTVVPVQEMAVPVALLLRRSGNDGDAACAKLGSDAGTALCVDRRGGHLNIVEGGQ